MRTPAIELLEDRRHFHAAAADTVVSAAPAAVVSETVALAQSDVSVILSQAASQAHPGQAVAVVDREGTVLGVFVRAGGDPAEQDTIVGLAIQRARTAAAFESTQNAFTTRTARFIIQNHFPEPVRNTPGGPLYGVEFSSFPGNDILPAGYSSGISGDPGGTPLFLGHVPVGGIGVAGDGRDRAPLPTLRDPLIQARGSYGQRSITRVFNGQEEKDYDESVSLAGARGYSAPNSIKATHIFIDGLRLPFTASSRARGQPRQTLDQLTTGGLGTLVAAPSAGLATADIVAGTPRLNNGEVAGVSGLFRNRDATLATAIQESTISPANELIDSDDQTSGVPDPDRLTKDDVLKIMENAVQQAVITRAGIRKPNGVKAQVHIAVVDRDGTVLGVFRMNDGTNFSYDTAIQKARTAAFFSDDAHAISTRAVGFISQKFFPPGIDGGIPGPLFQLQDQISFNMANLQDGPVKDGITIFPGGVPLYRNGRLIGAVGVSGDGVDQDDLVAFGGETGFRPADNIRSDTLPAAALTDYLAGKATALANDAAVPLGSGPGQFDSDAARRRLAAGLKDLRLPFVKFPRNPERK